MDMIERELVVVIATSTQAVAEVQAVPLSGGWGNPVQDADGLSAWGCWMRPCADPAEHTCVRQGLREIPGVRLFMECPTGWCEWLEDAWTPVAGDWRAAAGWVDPEPEDV